MLQGNARQSRQVPGQQAWGFLGIEAVGGDQGVLQLAQLLLQAIGEELLVEAGGESLVGHGVASLLKCCTCVDRHPGTGTGCGDVMGIRIT